MTAHLGQDVAATFDYLRDPPTDDAASALCYFTEDRTKSTMRVVPVEVPIIDGRPNLSTFDLDREGFQLVPHSSSIENFLDRKVVDAAYPTEISELIRAVTGASSAIAHGIGLRFGQRPANHTKTSDDQPARFPHADYTDETSAAMMVRYGFGGAYSRCALYNVWRVFSDPPQDYPLAVCDARSVSLADEEHALAILDLPGLAEPFQSMTTVYRANPTHRWTYFSNMNVGEALIFKAWDSDKSRAGRVPHSSFVNPLAGPDAPARCSIEARVLAYFT